MSERSGLLVLVGAAQNAKIGTGGDYLYSLNDRKLFKDWDIHIVDPTYSNYIKTDKWGRYRNINTIDDVNTSMLVELYNNNGFEQDTFYKETIEDYVRSSLLRGNYRRIVIISYTCEIETIIDDLFERYKFPVFNFGMAKFKLGAAMVSEALADYDNLVENRAVRQIINKIMAKLCNLMGEPEEEEHLTWNSDNDEDVQTYNDYVDLILLARCNNLRGLNMTYLNYAAARLGEKGTEFFGKRLDPKDKTSTLGSIGRTKHNFCGNEIRKYVTLEEIQKKRSNSKIF